MHFFTLLTAVLYPLSVYTKATHSFPTPNDLQGPLLHPEPLDHKCNCKDVLNTTLNPTYHVCSNASLGPLTLPWHFPLLSFVSNYDRFGRKPPAQFLQDWGYMSPQGRWRWRYPDKDGFHLDTDGKPIKAAMKLEKGFKVDRFGEETGSFMAAADASFNQRSLPPDALNVCPDPNRPCKPKDHPWSYHVYEVVREFVVMGGPIAPAFEQPGMGTQFQLINSTRPKTSVQDLVEWGYLRRMNLSEITLGPGQDVQGGCGKAPINCTCSKPE